MMAKGHIMSGRQGKTEEMRGTPRLIGALGAYLLVILVATAGCAPKDSDPPVPSNSAGSSPPLSQASRAAAPPTARLPQTRTKAAPQPTLPPTSTPTATALPSPTPTYTPTPTPLPVLRRLTQYGCCTQPYWSPDSRQVLFIDKPGANLPTGIWALDVDQVQPTPELLTERIAFYTPDLTLRTELSEDSTVIERLSNPLSPTTPLSGSINIPSDSSPNSGTESASDTDASSTVAWEVPSEGQPVSVSPSQTRIAWQKSDDDLPSERRTAEIWVADLDGTTPRMVATLPRGGFSGWISDEVILLSGRESLQAQEQVLFALTLADGSTTELARGKRIRGDLLSPDGAWLAYFVALDEDPGENGVWLVRTDGSERRKLPRDLFGAYQWRDAHRLLIIPFRPRADSHEIWEFDARIGQARRLTDPQLTPFKVANGDWTVSPDGGHVAFVESRDRNIWLLRLPD
jgi:hypothetical protein